MPSSRGLSRHQRQQKLSEEVKLRPLRRLRILLSSRQVKQHISLNNRARRLMQKDKLSRAMTMHVLSVELGIEFLRDHPRELIAFLEYVLERSILEFRVRLPFLEEAFWR